MTEKEILTQLIKHNDCEYIRCFGDKCPIQHRCSEHDDENFFNGEGRKHSAIEKYLELYGKEELMEILL